MYLTPMFSEAVNHVDILFWKLHNECHSLPSQVSDLFKFPFYSKLVICN
jgi:hypothetical protein